MPSFTFEGRRIAYAEHGSGERVLVLTHGLLMDRRMYTHLAPEMARRGNRVITVDMLGHGESDQPYETTAYSMTMFGRQVIALLDHLGIEQAVIGGTSLGANITLEAAVAAPERVRAMVVEMPVLENGLIAAAALFVPLALAIRLSERAMSVVATVMQRVPRTHYLIDIVLDWIRRDPKTSLAVLEGLLFGRVAPPVYERRGLEQPALIVGHPNDPLHPFSDADMLTRELRSAHFVDAKSILEWRITPRRLDDLLAAFLEEVWKPGQSARSYPTRCTQLPRS